MDDKADDHTLRAFHVFSGFRHQVPLDRFAELVPELARLNAADGPMRRAGVVCGDPWCFAVYQRAAAKTRQR